MSTETNRNYSQHGEQDYINQFFAPKKEPGKLLDIGAADGVCFSNTRALLENGWSGTLVEPSPFVFPRLHEHSAPFVQAGRVQCVNAAVGAVDDLAPWFDSGGDMLSTLSTAHKDLWEGPDGKVKFKPFLIPVISWHTLLKHCPGPYGFVNIDVEGTNWDVLLCMPIESVNPNLLCIEHSPTISGEHDRMITLMERRGYPLVKEIGPNLFFARRGGQSGLWGK